MVKTLSETIHEVMGLKPKTPTDKSNKPKNRFEMIKENARKHRAVMNRK
jgi:hypothetical protein